MLRVAEDSAIMMNIKMKIKSSTQALTNVQLLQTSKQSATKMSLFIISVMLCKRISANSHWTPSLFFPDHMNTTTMEGPRKDSYFLLRCLLCSYLHNVCKYCLVGSQVVYILYQTKVWTHLPLVPDFTHYFFFNFTLRTF